MMKQMNEKQKELIERFRKFSEEATDEGLASFTYVAPRDKITEPVLWGADVSPEVLFGLLLFSLDYILPLTRFKNKTKEELTKKLMDTQKYLMEAEPPKPRTIN